MTTSRRSFLTAALAAEAARAATKVLGANDRINLGLIGAGGRGQYHFTDLAKLKKLWSSKKLPMD